ncbi:MAG TPA: hypothetical protein VLF63_00220 [Patescibacteria group bacterium]|nr:hypothetical protein [Patescibacteria group bacterium]
MKDKPVFSFKKYKYSALNMLKKVGRYKVVVFILFVAGIYTYIYLNISNYTNQQPTQDQIQGQVKAAAIPHIDQSVVEKLKSLQDNSVSVQSLFDQARNSPFQTP